jgi:hypothetical protein
MHAAPAREHVKQQRTAHDAPRAPVDKLQLKRKVGGIEGFEAQSQALVPPSEDTPIQLKAATSGAELAGVQEKLNQLGYPAGPADGIMGPKTRGALKSFQSDHGLTPDGACGDETRAALDSAKPGDAPADKGAGGGGNVRLVRVVR